MLKVSSRFVEDPFRSSSSHLDSFPTARRNHFQDTHRVAVAAAVEEVERTCSHNSREQGIDRLQRRLQGSIHLGSSIPKGTRSLLHRDLRRCRPKKEGSESTRDTGRNGSRSLGLGLERELLLVELVVER